MQHISPGNLFAVLANTTRLRSLMLLFKHGELCVCDLTEVIGAAQPNISRNLAQMRDTGLLTDRRQGQWVYYQINPDVPAWVTDVLQAIASGTSDLNPYKNDDDVLAEMPTRSVSTRCS
jgi:ArsR family transcriptional regulator